MIALLLVLSVAPATAAEIDKAPSGAIVTIRPEAGERSCIVKGSDLVNLPSQAKNMWLISPAAWRKAIAEVTELRPLPRVIEEHKRLLAESENLFAPPPAVVREAGREPDQGTSR